MEEILYCAKHLTQIYIKCIHHVMEMVEWCSDMVAPVKNPTEPIQIFRSLQFSDEKVQVSNN